MSSALLLLAAALANLAGMAWLALAMEAHWAQVHGDSPLRPAAATTLRCAGAIAIGAALLLCLRADHATMAVLVWFMTLTAASVTVAFALAWRPTLLAALAPRPRR